jgi:hypothetical protein
VNIFILATLFVAHFTMSDELDCPTFFYPLPQKCDDKHLDRELIVLQRAFNKVSWGK